MILNFKIPKIKVIELKRKINNDLNNKIKNLGDLNHLNNFRMIFFKGITIFTERYLNWSFKSNKCKNVSFKEYLKRNNNFTISKLEIKEYFIKNFYDLSDDEKIYLFLTTNKEIILQKFDHKQIENIKIIFNKSYKKLKSEFEIEIENFINQNIHYRQKHILFFMEKFDQKGNKVNQIFKSSKLIYISNAKFKKQEKENEFRDFISEKLNSGYLIYEKNYLINKKGDVIKISWKLKKFNKVVRSTRINNHNDKRYTFSCNGKPKSVHISMAELFIQNNYNYNYVRARDNNYLNTKISNFHWVKYPAYSRVVNSFKNDEENWVNFIIKNFIPGLNISVISEIIATKAEEKNKFQNNHNKINTIHLTIKKYSRDNMAYKAFEIKKEFNNSVYLAKENISD